MCRHSFTKQEGAHDGNEGEPRGVAFPAACGIDVMLAWQFCLFPPALPSPLAGAFLSADSVPALNTAVVLANALGALLFLLAFPRLLDPHLPQRCAALGAACQALSYPALVGFGTTLAGAVCAGALMGISIACWWTAFMLLIARFGVEDVEKAFVSMLPFCAVGVLLPQAVGQHVTAGMALLVSPAASLAFFFLAKRRAQGAAAAAAPAIWGSQHPARSDMGAKTRLGSVVVQALAAYLCISLCRPNNPIVQEQPELFGLGACAIGFVAGAVVLWFFTSTTARVDITSSVRLVFPFLALGIASCVNGHAPLAFFGLCLLSACHAVLECSIRLSILSLVRNAGSSDTSVLATGLAIIGLGSVAGMAGNALLGTLGVGATDHALLCLPFLMAIVVTAFMGNQQPGESSAEPAGQDAAAPKAPTVCMVMAKKYMLTARETEILSYLLEGRSHPFIRDELGISKGTVDTHVRHIYAKVGVSRKQDLLSLAAAERESV